MNQVQNDNLYKEGTIITAKADPAVKLIIMRYRSRIYYCGIADDATKKHLAYYERELIAPVQ